MNKPAEHTGTARPAGGRAGHTVVRVLMAALVIGLLSGLAGWILRQSKKAQQCERNMARIYLALEMYEIDRGTLPALAFFPNDPQHDSDSLPVALKKYGVSGEMCICPALPPVLRELGITYVWNTRMNGKKLHEPGVRDWMLVEVNALSDQIGPPHLGQYNVLYTDGRVERTPRLPPDIRVP
jgi:prepilin-type processing-associated H-X9-DG protein